MAGLPRGSKDPVRPDVYADIPPLLTYEQFRSHWGISKTTLNRWVVDGTVKVVKRDRVTRITRAEFLRLVREWQS